MMTAMIRNLLHRCASSIAGFSSPVSYPYPALDIQLSGKRYLHLVGCIHMGTVDMSPLPAVLYRKLTYADALIVEADISDTQMTIERSAEIIRLSERLSTQHYQQLCELCQALGCDIVTLEHLPAWQVALLLQANQAQQLGLRPQYGIDHQLICAARQQQKRVIELEGIEGQLALLQQLPVDGMPLLQDTLIYWHDNARLLQTMVNSWITPVVNEIGGSVFPSTFSDEMYLLLLEQRNQCWQQQLRNLPAGHYVVAVGAMHLYGKGNLPRLLRAAR